MKIRERLVHPPLSPFKRLLRSRDPHIKRRRGLNKTILGLSVTPVHFIFNILFFTSQEMLEPKLKITDQRGDTLCCIPDRFYGSRQGRFPPEHPS